MLHLGARAWPLSPVKDQFSDFTIFADKYVYWHRPEFFSVGFPINYPAPLTDFYEVFFHYFPNHPTLAFVIFDLLCFVMPCIFFALALRKRGIAPLTSAAFSLSLLLFSWPALLLIDRGNMECAVWVATAIGFWALATGREKTAAVVFGMASSFKLFPIILLGIFLSQKKWSKLFLGLATMAVVSVVSLWILGPTIPEAYRGIAYGLASFKINYMARWRSSENGIDHSVFSFIKAGMMFFHLHDRMGFFLPLAIYTWVTVIGGITLYFVRIRRLPVLNQAMLLMISCIYFTAFSGDGTLIHLYPLFAMLSFLAIDAYRRGVTVPGLNTVLLWLTFVVSLATYFIYQGRRFEGQVKCIALGVLFLYALRYPFGPALGTDLRPDALAYPDASKVAGVWAQSETPS
ncbi:MAG TPA: glycosyltransferase family 87 protein [Acidobacteriaceae bacterium]